MSVRWQLLLVN